MLRDYDSETRFGESEPRDSARIRALVARFRVCWELYSAQIHAEEGIRNIGFDLELYGTPESGTERIMPGREHRRRVEAALEEIADWIIHRESPACSHLVSPDGPSLSYGPARANCPEVVVRVYIDHPQGWDQPTDESELRCLKEIEQALAKLGASKGRRSDARNALPFALLHSF